MTLRILVAIPALALIAFAGGPPSKLTFVKNGQVYVWTGSDREAQPLTGDPSAKRMPRWSPDGSRVVYWEVTNSPVSLGTLVVLQADGAVLGRFPVATVTPGGIRIEGMRGIQRIGWLSDEEVFAEGDINPYVSEFRAINTSSSQMHSFGGFDFAACSTAGILAFWKPVFPQDKTMTLVDSTSNRPLFEIPDVQGMPSLNVPLTWDDTCDCLGFIDPRSPPHLVAISIAEGKQHITAVPESLALTRLRGAPDGFFIGPDASLRFREGVGKIQATFRDVIQHLLDERHARRDAEEKLQAAEPDWWPPHSPD